MKRNEIKNCVVCDRGVCANNNLTFYKLQLTSYLVDVGAVRRQTGLEELIGHPGIANALGADEDIAIQTCVDGVVLVCLTCATHASLAEIIESLAPESS